MVKQNVNINQNVAILCDGNNIELSIHSEADNKNTMINFDTLIPKLLSNRGLNRLIYFREGKAISDKLAERLHQQFYGSVIPCHKTADIPLSIKATQLASKVDTIIIMSGDSDYIELVRHLKAEGVRVEIAAVRATTSAMLIREADYFHPITKDDWFVYNVNPRNNAPRNNAKRNHLHKQTPNMINRKQQIPQKSILIDNKITAEPPKLRGGSIPKIEVPSNKVEVKNPIKKVPVKKTLPKKVTKPRSLVSKLKSKIKKK